MDGFDARVAHGSRVAQHSLVTLPPGARDRRGIVTGRTDGLPRGSGGRSERGIFLIAGHEFTWETKLLAKVLAAGERRTLASHRAGAVLWDVEDFRPGRPELSVSPPPQAAIASTARIHESTDLHLADPVFRRGIPTTGLVRTLLDVGAVVSLDAPRARHRRHLADDADRMA